MSRGGRSVRFEIPEVPPPPSSPQGTDKDSLEGEPLEPSRNAVTVNTNIPKDTPSVSNKPMSGITVRTDKITVNTSLNTRENSIVKSVSKPPSGTQRELSMVSSPEPWPQVIEADYDVTPNTKTDSTLHMAPQKTETSLSDELDKEENKSANAIQQIKVEITKHTPEEPKSDFVNKDTEPISKVKKIMEESRKTDSPAPPPPSPEGKDDMVVKSAKSRNGMASIVEVDGKSSVEENESKMTVMQIQPKGASRKSKLRQIDTFVNIDIPASFSSGQSEKVPDPGTIMEESELEAEESNRKTAVSGQSTLANRTISEAYSEETASSMIEPAISQASQGPAVSEDFSDKHDKNNMFGEWTDNVAQSDVDAQATSISDKQDLDMTENGGDHDGFKEDLKREYEKLKRETEAIVPEATVNTLQ